MQHLELGCLVAPTILLLGAHCDDIEIGCGGTVRQLARRYAKARFVWVALSSDAQRAAETRAAAAQFLEDAKEYEVRAEQFPASYFPSSIAALKDYFEGLKKLKPDLIFTHCRHDLHQDHRVTNELTWNTFRNHLILEYEIPKYEGDLANPNVFVPLTRAQLARKIDIVTRCFASQRARGWFTEETFAGLARLRGVNCRAPDGVAEGFHVRKVVL